MVGSGTTLVEAMVSGRKGIGVDIDPLAVLISKAKTRIVEDLREIRCVCQNVLKGVGSALFRGEIDPKKYMDIFPRETRIFFDYWFRPETITELALLINEIRKVENPNIRVILETIFSSIIVTKSGGVSLARDLAHSRPHRDPGKRVESAVVTFRYKAEKALKALKELRDSVKGAEHEEPSVIRGDAKELPLPDESVDLIVTSPPYAVAIDYPRAHSFPSFG